MNTLPPLYKLVPCTLGLYTVFTAACQLHGTSASHLSPLSSPSPLILSSSLLALTLLNLMYYLSNQSHLSHIPHFSQIFLNVSFPIGFDPSFPALHRASSPSREPPRPCFINCSESGGDGNDNWGLEGPGCNHELCSHGCCRSLLSFGEFRGYWEGWETGG